MAEGVGAIRPRTIEVADRPVGVAVAPAPGRGVGWFRRTGWRHLVGLAAVVFALFPIAWIISASINPTGSIATQQFIPREPTLRHYRRLLSGELAPYVSWLFNTVLIGLVVAVSQVSLSAMAAYSFSRLRFAGRRLGLMTILLVQMFPQFLAMVAIFLFMIEVKGLFPGVGIGTKAGLVLVYLGGSLGVNTWLMKGFYDSIPHELDEAARIDGATDNQIFVKVILPLATPVLAVIALLSFVMVINEFILASILLQNPDDFTLAVGLQRFIDDRYGSRWGPFTAGALVGGLPVIALFLFLQRYLVSGLTSGAVKG
jgi:arabinogalactan oligomer / maltooligosaccharide transport system permease protein